MMIAAPRVLIGESADAAAHVKRLNRPSGAGHSMPCCRSSIEADRHARYGTHIAPNAP
jgi:hypothetical protein